MLRRVAPAFMTIAVMLFVANCSSDSNPTDSGGTGDETPSFAADILPILTTSCAKSPCHDETASAGLRLTSAVAYSNLVDVISSEDNSKKRIDPGDAQNSYLIMKLEGRQTVGERMPRGEAALPSSQIQLIRTWIDDGAPNN